MNVTTYQNETSLVAVTKKAVGQVVHAMAVMVAIAIFVASIIGLNQLTNGAVLNVFDTARFQVAMVVMPQAQKDEISLAFERVETLTAALEISQKQTEEYKAKLEHATSIKEAALNLTVRPVSHAVEEVVETVQHLWNTYEFKPEKIRAMFVSDAQATK